VNKFADENLCAFVSITDSQEDIATQGQQLNTSASKTVEEELMESMQSHLKPAAPVVLDVLNFWLTNASRFPVLSPLALDLLSAPASEAYAERIFSVCGELTNGKLNRTSKNLERRVFLRVNCSDII